MSPKYYRVPPEIHKGVVYGVESLAEIHGELRVLWDEHWEETERGYYESDMEPAVEELIALEKEGNLLQFTARAGGEDIVAQLIYCLAFTYQNRGRLRATEEGFFVRPEYRGVRGGGIALRLLDFAEQTLRDLGVKMICMGDKSPLGGPGLGSLVRRRGYQPVAIQYMKVIED